MDMKYNGFMLAYDVPLSALLYIAYAGVPEEYIVNRATEEETLAYIEILDRMREDKDDGF